MNESVRPIDVESEEAEIAGRHPDRIEHANVPQLAARTQLVDGGCRDPQVRRYLPDGQQRPQPVRRILGERSEICDGLESEPRASRAVARRCEALLLPG